MLYPLCARLLISFIFSLTATSSTNRVFSDRLVDDSDRDVFLGLLSDKLGTMLDFSYHNLCPNKVPPIFGT